VPSFCSYYVAKLVREKVWFVTGNFRNASHVAFERAIEGDGSTFEFLVPPDREEDFLVLMEQLGAQGCVVSMEKKENRFALELLGEKL
jgi:hypothetical protein